MPPPLSDATLDAVLAIQLTVSWAGEGRSEPKRLGWWDTDLVDPDGGGDFFARLMPHTAPWAALEAVREAARRVDARARSKMADPDKLRTLFFLGFEVDEQVHDRLAALKRSLRPPAEALKLPVALTASFDRSKVVQALKGDAPAPFAVVPGGRQLKGALPAEPDEVVRRLSSALVVEPIPEQYPLPFFAVPAQGTR
jgi:hypothetical protein